MRWADPHDLELGGEFDTCGYVWKPRDERPPDHQQDWDRLYADMEARGELVNPLIVHRGHVLIGQRRCEIARLLGWERVPYIEVDDPHPSREVAELRAQYAPVEY